MDKWKDVTTYSQGDKQRIPRIWELYLVNKRLRVSVHRFHGCEGWFMSCYQLNIERAELKATELAAAKTEALEVLHRLVCDYAVALGVAVAESRSAEKSDVKT